VNSVRLLTVCSIALSAMVHMIVGIASAQSPGAVRTPPLIVGTWKLNIEKSRLSARQPNMIDIRQYKLRDDGFLVGLLIQSDARGGYHYLQFTAKSDGRDYPEYSDDLLADMIAAGRQTPRTYSEVVVDEHVTEWTDKANGRVTSKGRKIISADGKTLTITLDGLPQTYIYDRQ
jgi:hypothetical protein